jgi:hypothetical protein
MDLPVGSGGIQSIAASGGRNDAGLFELSFRDERLLPFEGAGVISSWRVELPGTVRQFDYATISDVILHISYTALEGGGAFRQEREKVRTASLNMVAEVLKKTGLAKGFSLRHEFPNEWHQLRLGHEVSLTIGRDRLPYFVGALNPLPQGATWFVKSTASPKPLIVAKKEAGFEKDKESGLWYATSTILLDKALTLSFPDAKESDDLLLIASYTVQ